MIYELRKYIAHAGKADAMRQRFKDKTLPIFERLGIEVLHCWTTPEQPDALTYLVRFNDEAAQKMAWAAFGADAQWKEAKSASEVDGPLLASQSVSVLVPTSFSPADHK